MYRTTSVTSRKDLRATFNDRRNNEATFDVKHLFMHHLTSCYLDAQTFSHNFIVGYVKPCLKTFKKSKNLSNFRYGKYES